MIKITPEKTPAELKAYADAGEGFLWAKYMLDYVVLARQESGHPITSTGILAVAKSGAILIGRGLRQPVGDRDWIHDTCLSIASMLEALADGSTEVLRKGLPPWLAGAEIEGVRLGLWCECRGYLKPLVDAYTPEELPREA